MIFQFLTKTKISDFKNAVLKKYICRLKISVKNPIVVQILTPIADLFKNF